MAPVEGKALRSLQRKAKKIAKETDAPEADVLANLLAEAGLEEHAEEVKENKANTSEYNVQNGEVNHDGEGRTVSAVLTSHPLSRDVHIEQFTLLFHGHELLMDAALELNHGRYRFLLQEVFCDSAVLPC
jgi:hypothetical protein